MFSRAASAAAAPKLADVQYLNKLVRKMRFEAMELRFWLLKGKM